MNIIGLDLGNTRSKVAHLDETGKPQIILNRRGEPFTASAIFFENGQDPIVGSEALAEGLITPEHVHTFFKRALGSDEVLYTDANGKTFTATDLLAILIMALKRDIESRFNCEVDEAVIAVPANFKDHQKQAVIDAADQAGISVLRLVHEPTAAGIAYALDKQQDMTFLVYDLGGGTFDVSILKVKGNQITVLNTTGRERLGGGDFNVRIEKKVIAQFAKENKYTPTLEDDPLFMQELADKVEQVKLALSEKTSTKIVIGCRGKQLIMEITRDEFEKWTKDLLAETLTCTKEAVDQIGPDFGGFRGIDTIILVGGSVRMPAVQGALADLTGIVPHCDIEPDYAVAYGAALQCAMEINRQGKALMIGGRHIPAPKAFVQEVTAHSVGCCVAAKDGSLNNAVILPKANPIPTTKTDRFTLQHDEQTDARIEILQGEEGQPRDKCLVIGEIVLSNLPPEHPKTKRIEITYAIDANGMITATGVDRVSGQSSEISIDYHSGIDSQGPKHSAA